MARRLTMPRLGETMEQGTIRSWLVKPGIPYKRGDVIAEIETDKTVVEFPALEDGVVEQFLAKEGDVVMVGGPLAELAGEPSSAPSTSAAPELPSLLKEEKVASVPSSPVGKGGQRPDEGSHTRRPLASTAARKLAKRSGIDLAILSGTGRQGRIQGWDVRGALSAPALPVMEGGLHHAIRGEGAATPVVLLHGFGGDKDGWLSLSVPLAQHRKVIVFDLPGHGGSLKHLATGHEGMAAAISASLKELGLARVHLVGHSMGGGAALALALAEPGLAASLTLFAPAGIGPDINARLLTAYAAATEELEIGLVIGQFFGNDAKIPRGLAMSIAASRRQPGVVEGLRRCAAGMLDGVQQKTLPLEQLARLEAPVRVIWGEDDHLLPMTHARRLPGMVAVHRYRRVGHMPQIEIGRDAVRLVYLNLIND